jgi:CheY-like chemotaxis protein
MNRQERPTLVLLVGDDAAEIGLFSELLTDAGPRGKVRIESAGSVAEALNRLRQPPMPDLVITDHFLGADTGIDLIRQAKADDALAQVPILLLTGTNDPSVAEAAYDAHANAVLLKPADLASRTSLAGSIWSFWCEAVKLAPPVRSYLDDSRVRRLTAR